MTMQKHEERVCIFALFEDGAVLRKAQGAGFTKDHVEINVGKAREQRQMRDKRSVNFGHILSVETRTGGI
jgi:hypothetical protein